VLAWEVRAKQLGLLTPRRAGDPGTGTLRMRETKDMHQKRLAYRHKVQSKLFWDQKERRDNSTPFQAAEDTIADLVATIE
ncbi:unnamed protein product, partial [Choristocarpus tenellus]